MVSTSRLWQVVFEVEALASGDQEDLGGSIYLDYDIVRES